VKNQKSLTRFQVFLGTEFIYNFKKSKVAIISAIMFFLILLIAIFGPNLTPQNPYNLRELFLSNANRPPFWMEGGSTEFLFGTDQNGRDMMSAIVHGSRVSLYISVVGVFMSAFVGIGLGLIAGYFGGKFDTLIMRIADIQLSFPSMLIALFLMGIFGASVKNILIALTLIGWVSFARVVRGEVLSVKKKEYVEAARVLGFPNLTIILKQVLPNVLTSVIVIATMRIGSFIMVEATLSFLGIGVPMSQPSLGTLCNEGFKVLYSGLWWVSIFPGLYIVFIVLSVNLLGDFLRDELNPKLK